MNGRPASRQGLRKPLRQHYARSAEASTLRTTFVDGEQVLSAWMAENAFVSWVMRERPWDLEDDLIRELDLPLNLQGNSRNRIHPALTEARARCLAQARALPVLPDQAIRGPNLQDIDGRSRIGSGITWMTNHQCS